MDHCCWKNSSNFKGWSYS